MTFKSEPEAPAASSRPMHWSTDPACWRNYCEDLIYAAASLTMAADAYTRQIERRRTLDAGQRSSAIRAAEGIHEALLALWPEAPTGLALARLAWGDDRPMSGTERRQIQDATLARCARWLPKPPPSVRGLEQAERARRSGITEEQRWANANATAASLGQP